MKILVLNCGSSSLKYQLIDMDDESVMAKGLVDRIGLNDSLLSHKPTGKDKYEVKADIENHDVVIKMVFDARRQRSRRHRRSQRNRRYRPSLRERRGSLPPVHDYNGRNHQGYGNNLRHGSSP